jgi:ribosome-associated toxin RatA of RatAB toxin-antitoxin module
MKHVQKSVLLWYSPHEMYALVTAVEDYPSFLPWCERVEVLERGEQGGTARLWLRYAGLHHCFTTRNTNEADRSVHLQLVDGPFTMLDGMWQFRPIGGGDAVPVQACKIDFSMRYAFARGPLEVLVSPVFDRIANTFVDAFVKRAEQVYGAR